MKRLFSFYGDDFTGSSDAMEALAINGVKTVLFTRLPSPERLAQFDDHEAIGLAGTSRSETPQWMDRELPPVFHWLKGLGARLCHYKVCSTFDSSPGTGSIGRAIEIASRVFGQDAVPLIVGAPQLKRYTFAGHLFAAYQGVVYRIDRHPVMRNHPVTPMDEADLRLHLARQTAHQGIRLLDVWDDASQMQAGRHVMALDQRFIAGSSGVEYALLAALREAGVITGSAAFPALAPVERLLAVSGSCSPTTARQIDHALAHGFDGIAADALALATDGAAAIDAAVSRALAALAAGRSAIIHTARGAADRGAALDAIPNGRHRVGEALGEIARRIVERAKLTRLVIAGGDSSSHALAALDVFALTTRAPVKTAPGSPVCLAHSAAPSLQGLELAMKGGQIGGDDYFAALRDGRS